MLSELTNQCGVVPVLADRWHYPAIVLSVAVSGKATKVFFLIKTNPSHFHERQFCIKNEAILINVLKEKWSKALNDDITDDTLVKSFK